MEILIHPVRVAVLILQEFTVFLHCAAFSFQSQTDSEFDMTLIDAILNIVQSSLSSNERKTSGRVEDPPIDERNIPL